MFSAEDDGVVAARVAEALTAGEAVTGDQALPGVKDRSLGYLGFLLLAGSGARGRSAGRHRRSRHARWWKDRLGGAPIILEESCRKLSGGHFANGRGRAGLR